MFPPEHFGLMEGGGGTVVSGLAASPGINVRYHLTLVRNDDYTGNRALYFPAQSGELWPTLTEGDTITLTMRIDGVTTPITGEVVTVDDEAMPKVEIPGTSLPLAGTGVFDVEHIAGGVVTTLLMGDVKILADVTIAEEE